MFEDKEQSYPCRKQFWAASLSRDMLNDFSFLLVLVPVSFSWSPVGEEGGCRELAGNVSERLFRIRFGGLFKLLRCAHVWSFLVNPDNKVVSGDMQLPKSDDGKILSGDWDRLEIDPLLRFTGTTELLFFPVSISVNELDLLVSFRFGEIPLVKISRLNVCVQRLGSCFVRVLDFRCVKEGDTGGLSRRLGDDCLRVKESPTDAEAGEDCLRVNESPTEAEAGEGDRRLENEKG